MAYKLLGYTVWRGGKWYVRRRFPGAGRTVALAALAGGMLAGGMVLTRAVRSGNQ